MTARIVVAGSSNTDMILQVERIPQPGETILGRQFSMAAGGKGANQAVAAARAGGDVTFLARVGDDIFGERAIEGFRRDAINVDHVWRDGDAPSGVALIFVAEGGENSIGVASGANSRLSAADIESAADPIASADVLLIQLETPIETVERAAAVAAAAGVRVILNPAPAQPLGDDLLKRVSVLTPNESEAGQLTDVAVTDVETSAAAARVLRSKGVETVTVTLGSRGVYVDSDEFTGAVPAFEVEPVDTTAAGDVFNGALAVAVSEGTTLPLAVRFASAAAALSVTKLGAQSSAPTRGAIEAFLANR